MLLLLDDGSIIAARDRLGRTPIIAGRHMTEEGSYALSSESCAFSNLGYEIAKNIGPGEIVRISSDKGIEQLQAPGDKMQICAFLWTYYGYRHANMKVAMSMKCATHAVKKWGVKMIPKLTS